MSELTDDQLDRYARHIILKEIGGAGQLKLRVSRVAIVGAGGLGSPCIQYLAAAGIGQLTIIDDDSVALSNLQRQLLFGTDDVGRAKTDAATDAVARLNPDVAVNRQHVRLTPENATALLAEHDVVADGSDSFATRLAVADAAHALRIPLVSAAVGPFEGQLATFRGWQSDLPCYRCYVGAATDRAGESCADQGIIGALAGVIGAMQALEVIRELTGFGTSLAGRLLLYDALATRMRTLRLPKDPGCPGCGNQGNHP
jgi:molybdopterin/thiamine biosynthesis adenylyltransferase